jgi:hypothetical protein
MLPFGWFGIYDVIYNVIPERQEVMKSLVRYASPDSMVHGD